MQKLFSTFSRKINAFLLIYAMILSLTLASCSNTTGTGNTTGPSDTETETAETEEPRDTRFDNVNFDGHEFRIYTSINTNDATNANALIEGTGELNGEAVNDAVYTRNQTTEEQLGIKLVFTQSDFDYGAVTANIRKFVLAADDAYELIINDLFPAAELTYEGMLST